MSSFDWTDLTSWLNVPFKKYEKKMEKKKVKK